MMPDSKRNAESPSDLLSQSDIASMSGLAFLRGMLEGRFPSPPICKTLNFWLHDVQDGTVTFRGEPRFQAMNPIGAIHGGWFGAILDSCMGCAVQSTLPQGSLYTTLEYRLNILRALMPDSGQVEAIGTVIRVGRRTGVAEGRLIGVEDGRLYATGTTTCLVMKQQD